jgi:hypothetical protein
MIRKFTRKISKEEKESVKIQKSLIKKQKCPQQCKSMQIEKSKSLLNCNRRSILLNQK